MVDFDAHIGRALQGARVLCFLLAGYLLWRRHETQVKFGISVDHFHLLAELSRIEPLGCLDWWRCLHREN